MKSEDISPIIKEKAPLILAEIKKAKSVLLHCHPSPDPDSVGSALAMSFALESMGKKATVIKGDSDIPQAFMHFPGAKDIVQKNFFEVDLSEFDLFIVLDGASAVMISQKAEVKFPPELKVVVIDHHFTNAGFGAVNLLEPSYPANCQILFDLFQEWKVELTPEIASNLFMGIYTDTGAFKFAGVNAHTFDVARQLVSNIPDLPRLISDMENFNTPGFMIFEGLALSNIRTFLGGKMVMAVVSNEAISAKKCIVEDMTASEVADNLCIRLNAEDVRASEISSFLRTVPDWQITACAVEKSPGNTRISFRSGSKNIFDVSKLAAALGGGGHKFASGLTLAMPIEEAVSAVVAKAKELYMDDHIATSLGH